MDKNESDLRRCEVDGTPALFHKWSDIAEIVPPSMLKGGHGGGTIQDTFAIVEYDDGHVGRVKPERIVFVDKKTNNKSEEKIVKNKCGISTINIECPFCPHCEIGNKNAVLYCDTTANEFFVYCQKCGIETIDSFQTSARAIKAFKDGKTKKIKEV